MKPFQNIAVGYDGSPDATIAVRWALDAARDLGGAVTVVHATGLREHQHEHFSHDVIPPALLALAHECAFDESQLRWLVQDGDPCSVLLRMTSSPVNADVLVVGSRGEGKREGLLLGSTSLEVAEHATVPVVVVPSKYRELSNVKT
jgi:nucleotide-binding universal stress UspA family protein